jgi:oxalate decarboxylase
MSSKLFFSLDAIKPQKSYAGGSITYATSDEVPGFINISFAALKLNKGGSQEPIWHPNAHKIGYVTKGNGLVSIRSPGGVDTFTITKGDVFYIPRGYIHHVMNTGDGEAVINFAFDNTKPETMCLSKALFSLSGEVFTATFNTPADFLEGLKKNKNDDCIKVIQNKKDYPKEISNRYKFNIENSAKPVLTKGGFLQLATQTNLPVLNGLAILGFGLNPKGAVEPHWHTNAGELVYIVTGKTLITVLSPDGKVEKLEVNAGQGAFAPASHFHNILNVGSDDVEVIAYFSDANPDYIGIGEVIGSYSNEVLASVFNVSPNYFDSFKKPTGPEVIVPL